MTDAIANKILNANEQLNSYRKKLKGKKDDDEVVIDELSPFYLKLILLNARIAVFKSHFIDKFEQMQ